MDEFQKALEDLTRSLGLKYGLPDPPDATELQLQYGKYVCHEALDLLIKRGEFSPPDAAELRVRNAEAALGARLVPEEMNFEYKFQGLEGNGALALVDHHAVKKLAEIEPVNAFRQLFRLGNLQIVEVARKIGLSKPGMNSFLSGVPLRRSVFARLCEVLDVGEDVRKLAYLRFLWAQMYCAGLLLEGLVFKRGYQNPDPREQGHLFAMALYWSENQEYLRKMTGIRMESKARGIRR